MTNPTELLLEATDVSKAYGAVVALRRASIAVRPGEVHALMGANGAGKSTFVKILTGAVAPDTGRIVIRNRERVSHSPAEARRNGLLSVYQEPAVIPDLDIRDNLRLTATPVEPFRHWVNELGLDELSEKSLEPAYEAVERRIRVAEVPASMRSEATWKFVRGAERLGIPMYPIKRNTEACVGNGRCNFGCPSGAKLSVDVSYLPAALARGGRVVSDALVERVNVDHGRAVGVSGRLLDGP